MSEAAAALKPPVSTRENPRPRRPKETRSFAENDEELKDRYYGPTVVQREIQNYVTSHPESQGKSPKEVVAEVTELLRKERKQLRSALAPKSASSSSEAKIVSIDDAKRVRALETEKAGAKERLQTLDAAIAAKMAEVTAAQEKARQVLAEHRQKYGEVIAQRDLSSEHLEKTLESHQSHGEEVQKIADELKPLEQALQKLKDERGLAQTKQEERDAILAALKGSEIQENTSSSRSRASVHGRTREDGLSEGQRLEQINIALSYFDISADPGATTFKLSEYRNGVNNDERGTREYGPGIPDVDTAEGFAMDMVSPGARKTKVDKEPKAREKSRGLREIALAAIRERLGLNKSKNSDIAPEDEPNAESVEENKAPNPIPEMDNADTEHPLNESILPLEELRPLPTLDDEEERQHLSSIGIQQDEEFHTAPAAENVDAVQDVELEPPTELETGREDDRARQPLTRAEVAEVQEKIWNELSGALKDVMGKKALFVFGKKEKGAFRSTLRPIAELFEKRFESVPITSSEYYLKLAEFFVGAAVRGAEDLGVSPESLPKSSEMVDMEKMLADGMRSSPHVFENGIEAAEYALAFYAKNLKNVINPKQLAPLYTYADQLSKYV